MNAHAAKRFLVFRDADAWLEYQAEFGKGNLFDWIMFAVDSPRSSSATRDIMRTKKPHQSGRNHILTVELNEARFLTSVLGPGPAI